MKQMFTAVLPFSCLHQLLNAQQQVASPKCLELLKTTNSVFFPALINSSEETEEK